MYRRLQALLPANRKRAKALEELASADPDVRARAAVRLGELKHPAAIEPLVRGLEDPEAAVREQAAWALAEIGPPAGPAIVRSLGGTVPSQRARLFEVLGRTRSGEGAAAAVAALADPDPGVRLAAGEALRRIAEPARVDSGPSAEAEAVDDSAAADLVIGLGAPELEVRLESAQALATLRYRPAAAALLAVLRNPEENNDVRGNAAIALGRIGEMRAMSPILALLEDEQTEGYAAEALCAMSGGLDEMVRRLKASPRRRGGSGEHPRARVVRTLGALGNPASIGTLFRAAVDPEPNVRIAVIRALGAVLGEVHYQRSVERDEYARLRTAIADVLKLFLSDGDGRVRLTALERQMDLPDHDRLVALASDPDPGVRCRACAELGQRGAPAFDTLAAARADEDELVRCAAVGALGRIDDARVLPLLVASVGDSSPRVRSSVAYALGPDKPRWSPAERPMVRDALVRALGDEEVGVRESSVLALRHLDDPEAGDALIAALGDRESSMRAQVAQALQYLGVTRAIPALQALASDPDESVRRAAATAVMVLGRSR